MKDRRCRIMGLALSLAWSFCAFPPISNDATFWMGMPFAIQVLFRLNVVGLLPCLILPLVPQLVVGRHFARTAVVGSLLWSAGWLVGSQAAGDASAVTVLAGTFVMGAGTSFYLVYWGVAFCRGDEEDVERGFIATIVVAGLVIVALNMLPREASYGVTLVIPWLDFGLLVWGGCSLVARSSDGRFESIEGNTAGAARDGSPSNEGESLRIVMLRTALSITFVSFTWCMFSMQHELHHTLELYIFGVGFMLSGTFIWLFVKFSPSVGFAAATRWVLPLMAVGLLCNVSTVPAALLCACLLLSMSHAVFEMLLRMQIVRFARGQSEGLAVSMGWGFASIMAGAFLGPTLYGLIANGVGVDLAHLTLWILAALVIAGSLLFSNASTKAARRISAVDGRVAGDCQEGLSGGNAAGPSNVPHARAEWLANRYALTSRETEILAMLLEGRSRPYIRDTLYVSISTVDTHVRHIYSKAGVHNKQELINLSLAEDAKLK